MASQGVVMPDQLRIVGKHLAHALCMVLAFGLLFPSALAVSLGWRSTISAKFWFRWVSFLALSGFATALSGLGVAIWMTPIGSHFNNAHEIVGVAVIGLFLLQPMYLFACRKIPQADKLGALIVYRSTWEWIHKLGGVAVIAGATFSVISGYMHTQQLELYGISGLYGAALKPRPPPMEVTLILYGCLLFLSIVLLVVGVKQSAGLKIESRAHAKGRAMHSARRETITPGKRSTATHTPASSNVGGGPCLSLEVAGMLTPVGPERV
eukprot:scaffold212397_cov32-Tisochrysis_lutea.AAC.1